MASSSAGHVSRACRIVFFSRIAAQDGTMEGAPVEPFTMDRTARKATPRHTESKVLLRTSIYRGTNRRSPWSSRENVGGLFGPNSHRRVCGHHPGGATGRSVPETGPFAERADHHAGDPAALSGRPARPSAETSPACA